MVIWYCHVCLTQGQESILVVMYIVLNLDSAAKMNSLELHRGNSIVDRVRVRLGLGLRLGLGEG